MKLQLLYSDCTDQSPRRDSTLCTGCKHRELNANNKTFPSQFPSLQIYSQVCRLGISLCAFVLWCQADSPTAAMRQVLGNSSHSWRSGHYPDLVKELATGKHTSAAQNSYANCGIPHSPLFIFLMVWDILSNLCICLKAGFFSSHSISIQGYTIKSSRTTFWFIYRYILTVY